MPAPERTLIRAEQPGDRAGIRRVNDLAFGQDAEGRLVDALREAGALVVSLVAERDGEVVGHVAFSTVALDDHPDATRLAGLGPMAVLPALQRGGIGSALLRAGIASAAGAGFDAVVLLGYPEYYPRFGFAPASRLGLRCTYDAPDAAFMALELRPGALAGLRGTVRYAAPFDLL